RSTAVRQLGRHPAKKPPCDGSDCWFQPARREERILLSATHWTPVIAPLEAAVALFKTFCIICRATTLNFGGDFRRDQSA
ncbi:hypothetical protein AAE028_35505, partial [Sinorhizobium sp. CB9]